MKKKYMIPVAKGWPKSRIVFDTISRVESIRITKIFYRSGIVFPAIIDGELRKDVEFKKVEDANLKPENLFFLDINIEADERLIIRKPNTQYLATDFNYGFYDLEGKIYVFADYVLNDYEVSEIGFHTYGLDNVRSFEVEVTYHEVKIDKSSPKEQRVNGNGLKGKIFDVEVIREYDNSNPIKPKITFDSLCKIHSMRIVGVHYKDGVYIPLATENQSQKFEKVYNPRYGKKLFSIELSDLSPGFSHASVPVFSPGYKCKDDLDYYKLEGRIYAHAYYQSIGELERYEATQLDLEIYGFNNVDHFDIAVEYDEVKMPQPKEQDSKKEEMFWKVFDVNVIRAYDNTNPDTPKINFGGTLCKIHEMKIVSIHYKDGVVIPLADEEYFEKVHTAPQGYTTLFSIRISDLTPNALEIVSASDPYDPTRKLNDPSYYELEGKIYAHAYHQTMSELDRYEARQLDLEMYGFRNVDHFEIAVKYSKVEKIAKEERSTTMKREFCVETSAENPSISFDAPYKIIGIDLIGIKVDFPACVKWMDCNYHFQKCDPETDGNMFKRHFTDRIGLNSIYIHGEDCTKEQRANGVAKTLGVDFCGNTEKIKALRFKVTYEKPEQQFSLMRGVPNMIESIPKGFGDRRDSIFENYKNLLEEKDQQPPVKNIHVLIGSTELIGMPIVVNPHNYIKDSPDYDSDIEYKYSFIIKSYMIDGRLHKCNIFIKIPNRKTVSVTDGDNIIEIGNSKLVFYYFSDRPKLGLMHKDHIDDSIQAVSLDIIATPKDDEKSLKRFLTSNSIEIPENATHSDILDAVMKEEEKKMKEVKEFVDGCNGYLYQFGFDAFSGSLTAGVVQHEGVVYKRYDKKKGKIINVDRFVINCSKVCKVIPTVIDDVGIGDILLYDANVVFVKAIDKSKNITGVGLKDNCEIKIVPEYYMDTDLCIVSKVVNLLNPGKVNYSMLMMSLMNDKKEGVASAMDKKTMIMMMAMQQNQTNGGNANNMLPLLLMGDDIKDDKLVMFMMMQNQQNNGGNMNNMLPLLLMDGKSGDDMLKTMMAFNMMNQMNAQTSGDKKKDA